MELKSLTYTSWARPALSAQDLEAILASARINNPLDGLTGVLIFNGSNFMQILEGAEPAIDHLIRRLAADSRHSNMSIRHERIIERRSFPDWAMAYSRVENGEFVGEDEVERALRRELPASMRNLLLGLVHNVRAEGAPGVDGQRASRSAETPLS